MSTVGGGPAAGAPWRGWWGAARWAPRGAPTAQPVDAVLGAIARSHGKRH